MTTEDIQWRPVKGQEDAYEVSSTGLVRRKAYLLKTYPAPKGGHHQVNLGLKRRAYVHRLIAEAFLEPSHPGQIWVNHKNGNPGDNRLDNLEWCTPGENIAHGYRHNGRVDARAQSVAAVSDDGEILAEFVSVAAASRSVGRTPRALWSAIQRGGNCAGRKWVLT